jgi:hypothetical protein
LSLDEQAAIKTRGIRPTPPTEDEGGGAGGATGV